MPALGRRRPATRDYSPSRIKYRLQRIWLTPLYRSLIRTGIPAALLLGLATHYLMQPQTQERLAASIAHAREMIESRPEFAVTLMRIEGASPAVTAQVREALSLKFPVSSLRLDLHELKARVEAVAAVRRADLVLRGGVLEVRVVERVPALVWRSREGLELVDATGAGAGRIESREGHETLPLVIGAGAKAAAPEALRILAAAGPIRDRIRALRRMGERRWDILLDRGQVIRLPVERPVRALERVIALDRARDLLARDVEIIDMRDARRPVLRLSEAAMGELQRLRARAEERQDGKTKKEEI